MTVPWPVTPVPFPIVIFIVVVCVALGFVADRALRRRQRRAHRRRLGSLSNIIRQYLSGRVPLSSLQRAVSQAEESAFWTTIETASLRWTRAELRQVASAVEHHPHLVTERRALRSDSPWRRVLAARRLALLPAPRSRRALRRALTQGPEPVAYAAARGLARWRDGAALRWILAHPGALEHRPPAALLSLLRGFGPRACPLLAEALDRDHGPRFDGALIEALGLAGYRPASLVIERRMADSDADVRIAAARALGRLQAIESATSLLAGLRDDAWQVRAQSARSLGLVRAPIAIEPLARRLTDKSWWVRRHAAYALLQLGVDGQNALRAVARDSTDPYARDMAVEALESLDAQARKRSA